MIPEDQIASLEKRLARAEAALAMIKDILLEGRKVYWTQRALLGAIPCSQIAMLAEQDLLALDAHLFRVGES